MKSLWEHTVTGEQSEKSLTQELEDAILFGSLRPREHLVEDDLMKRYGAKRHAVRNALQELERTGIVIRRPNKGAIVRDFAREDVVQIYEMRELLQAKAARIMPLPADPVVVAELIEIQRLYDAAVEKHDLRQVGEWNDRFHSRLFAACGNRYLSEDIDRYFYLMRAARMYPLADPEILAKAQREHWSMIDAMRDGDRDALLDLCIEHIQASRRIYLSIIS